MRTVKTRKAHMCSYCGKDIEKGETAKVESVRFTRVSGIGFYWSTYYYHLSCRAEPRFT